MTETPITGLTLSEAAEATNKSRVTLRRWLDEGRFPNQKRDESDPNRPWRIPVEDLVNAGALIVNAPENDAAMTQAMIVKLAVAEAVAAERADALERMSDLTATVNRLLDRLEGEV